MKILGLNTGINRTKSYPTSNKPYNLSFQGIDDKFIKDLSAIKTGDKITGIGLVIDTPKIRNNNTGKTEDCLITYQNDNKNGCFRLIKNDKTKIQKIAGFFKSNKELYKSYENNSFSFSDELLSQIKKISPETAADIEDLSISEIVYTSLCKKQEIQRAQELGYKKIDNNKDIVCIQNFIVYKKEYNNASRYVSVPVLRSLYQNKDKNIIIKANAFGKDSASPVNLYLRYGFLPLKVSLEDIEKHKIKTSKGTRIDPSYHVIMYLPKDAVLYDILKKICPKYEIDAISPKWFKRID